MRPARRRADIQIVDEPDQSRLKQDPGHQAQRDAAVPALPAATLAGGAGSKSTADERRRRRRRPYRQPGWVYRADRVVQVHMRNISADGAGFVCDDPVRKGERLHVKVGLGITRRPRPAEVMYARRRDDGRFEVGVRFVRASAEDAR